MIVIAPGLGFDTNDREWRGKQGFSFKKCVMLSWQQFNSVKIKSATLSCMRSFFTNITSACCLYISSMNKCRNKGIVYRNEEKEVNKAQSACAAPIGTLQLGFSDRKRRPHASRLHFLSFLSTFQVLWRPHLLNSLPDWSFLTLSVFLNIDTLVRLRWIYAAIAKKKKVSRGQNRDKWMHCINRCLSKIMELAGLKATVFEICL